MFKTIKFANMDWLVWKEEEDRLYLRTVESIGQHTWDSVNGRNWSKCALRKYLNGEFYDSLPEEDRKKIIPVVNKTNTRKKGEFEETEDKVWLNGLEDVGTFMHEENYVPTWLRNPCVGSEYYILIVWDEGFPYFRWVLNAEDVRPCVCIKKADIHEDVDISLEKRVARLEESIKRLESANLDKTVSMITKNILKELQ